MQTFYDTMTGFIDFMGEYNSDQNFRREAVKTYKRLQEKKESQQFGLNKIFEDRNINDLIANIVRSHADARLLFVNLLERRISPSEYRQTSLLIVNNIISQEKKLYMVIAGKAKLSDCMAQV